MSVLVYWLLRTISVISWIARFYGLPLLVVALLATYICLMLHLRRKVFSALKKVAEEGFNVREVPELLEHFQERCMLDDARIETLKGFVPISVAYWLLYYALIVLAVSIADHYEAQYGYPPVSTLLFDVYAVYTLAFTFGALIVSTYLAYNKYVEREEARGGVLAEWIEEIIEDYTVNNCLRGVRRGKPSRILAIFTPLVPAPRMELLRPISIPPLPAPLAKDRLNTLLKSGRYGIEPLKSEGGDEADKIIEEMTKSQSIENLKKGLLDFVKVVKVFELRDIEDRVEGRKVREFLGYLIAVTTPSNVPPVQPSRYLKEGGLLQWLRTTKNMTHIYLLALHPGMVKLYTDLLILRRDEPQKSGRKQRSTT